MIRVWQILSIRHQCGPSGEGIKILWMFAKTQKMGDRESSPAEPALEASFHEASHGMAIALFAAPQTLERTMAR